MQRWLHRDPLEYVDGPHVYFYSRNNPIRWSDPTGLACTVWFKCSLSGSSLSGDKCTRNCAYICIETSRAPSLTGGTDCEDMPKAPMMDTTSSTVTSKLCLLCGLGRPGPCPPSHTIKRVYYATPAPPTCSRSQCCAQCDSAEQIALAACNALVGQTKTACKAAARSAAQVCRDACNSYCKRP